MLLNNTEGYILTEDVKVKNDGDTYTSRVEINRELSIGEAAFVGNTRNKIKRLSEKEFMFIRKEATLNNNWISSKQLNKLKRVIQNDLGDRVYLSSSEKVKHIKAILERNPWIEDITFTSYPCNATDEDMQALLDELSTYITDIKI
ncbi:hypothetical protein [Bacillus swezeyi]|uniref:Uncharacterized protein n=1 Tax=Bacillus swezeyi TaxID=1925020 RepID=A0A5M8RZT6_9BACI|nr:hypothetical protein [Bacillus swezeyi]KAA6452686.1 hypothetical protein DX927_00195 [Bacillus swezeyi]TYS38054.1 hypothetical protein FZC77_00115 [Bacillus swezeyi]